MQCEDEPEVTVLKVQLHPRVVVHVHEHATGEDHEYTVSGFRKKFPQVEKALRMTTVCTGLRALSQDPLNAYPSPSVMSFAEHLDWLEPEELVQLRSKKRKREHPTELVLKILSHVWPEPDFGQAHRCDPSLKKLGTLQGQPHWYCFGLGCKRHTEPELPLTEPSSPVHRIRSKDVHQYNKSARIADALEECLNVLKQVPDTHDYQLFLERGVGIYRATQKECVDRVMEQLECYPGD